MEFRQLKYFACIAEELHYGNAAKKLFVSQPALSQQVQLLENEIGVELFARAKRTQQRKVELTEAGAAFLKDAKKILQLAERAVENARRVGTHKKEIRLGFYKMALRDWIVEITHLVSTHFPDVEVKMVELPTVDDVQSALLNEIIDMGFTLLPLKDPGLSAKIYKKDALWVILSASHSLASQEIIPLEKLRHEKWVVISKPLHPFYKYIEGLCLRAGFSREANVVQEASTHELLCSYVGLGIGVAFIPSLFDWSREPGIVAKKVVLTDEPSGTEIEVTHALAWKSANASPQVQAALELVGGEFV